MPTPTFEEIAGAVARGWCSPENARKEMDSDLAYAITNEIESLLAAKALPWPIRLRLRLLMPFSCRWNAWVRDWTARLER